MMSTMDGSGLRRLPLASAGVTRVSKAEWPTMVVEATHVTIVPRSDVGHCGFMTFRLQGMEVIVKWIRPHIKVDI
jgi:hypothetical protein